VVRRAQHPLLPCAFADTASVPRPGLVSASRAARRRRCLWMPVTARSPRPSRSVPRTLPNRQLWSDAARVCIPHLVCNALRRYTRISFARTYITSMRVAIFCGRMQVSIPVPVPAVASGTDHRHLQAMPSTRPLPSVAWPDVTGEFKALRAQLEHAERQHAETASALRASQASEIELQRQLDDVKDQLRRVNNERGREIHPRAKPSRAEPSRAEPSRAVKFSLGFHISLLNSALRRRDCHFKLIGLLHSTSRHAAAAQHLATRRPWWAKSRCPRGPSA
jgi:hypothetical protein